MVDVTAARCACCRRPLLIAGHAICTRCQTDAVEMLTDLPRLLRRLALCLMPGGGGARGGRVRSSKTAPLPVRLDPLSLIGAGSVRVPETMERRVIARQEVITVLVDGQPVDVKIWHRALAYGPEGNPVYVAAGDQRDPLPIPTWLDMWEALVRRHFGDVDPPLPALYRARVDRRAYTRAVLHSDRLAVGVDPLEIEVATRFGITAGRTRTDDAADYLAHRLPDICQWMEHTDAPATDMLTELRGLYAAARATAGESDDLMYLGRCPETLLDRHADVEHPCGAHLMHDPYVTDIQCPRCRTVTPQRKWLWLARRIRDTWGVTSEVAA